MFKTESSQDYNLRNIISTLSREQLINLKTIIDDRISHFDTKHGNTGDNEADTAPITGSNPSLSSLASSHNIFTRTQVEGDIHEGEEKLINRKRKITDFEDTTVYSLPDELLSHCISYVGRGNFLFVATVSKRFYKCYASLCLDKKTRADGNASDSLSCAKMCFGRVSSAFEECLFRHAVTKGNVDVVYFALSHNIIENAEKALTHRFVFSVIHNNLPMLKLLHSYDVKNIFCYALAAEGGYFDAAKWFYANDSNKEASKDFIYEAVARNDLSALKFGVENKFPWDAHVLYFAAYENNMEMVQYCLDNDCPRSCEYTCAVAARKGNIKILKLLRKYSFSWDSKTCQEAARKGHLKTLKWARHNGCPWDAKTYGMALIYKNANDSNREKADEIISYLVLNGCPTLNNDSAIALATNSHLFSDFLDWLSENNRRQI